MGVESGPYGSYYSVPASGTDQIVNIDTTNGITGKPGFWIFHLNQSLPHGCENDGVYVIIVSNLILNVNGYYRQLLI